MQPRPPYNPKKILLALAVLAVLVFYPYLRAARSPKAYVFDGSTMGTYYKITVATSHLRPGAVKDLQETVEARLAGISRQMSTYDPQSEISRFNAMTQTTEFACSPELAEVTALALELARRSNGAFDPTVGPLLQLWGFGPDGAQRRVPEADAIAEHLERTGHRRLLVYSRTSLRKLHPQLALDLNAVAKGYAVDEVARIMREGGCSNVFVEIGGEIMACGNSGNAAPWRVSVETPNYDAPLANASYAVVPLSNLAVATSGDYRNYFSDQGQAFSHVLDPRKGWPVSNGVASVTVVARDCMSADGLATALMVIGADAADDLLAQYEDAEALIILRDADGAYTEWRSDGFPG